MKVTYEEFKTWVNKVISENGHDFVEFELENGYYVTMCAFCKYANLMKDCHYYGSYDFWRFATTDCMVAEIWLDAQNAIKHDSDKSPYCKAGRVELTYVECDRIARHGELIVAYRDIYELRWSDAQGRYYASKLYHYDGVLGLTSRGRWNTFTPKAINNMLGFDLFCTSNIVVEKVLEKMNRTA
jgi:hypothetical protein